jgi:hypothetical protein
MKTYQIKVGGDVRMTFSADFAQASSQITLEGNSTPFQVADAGHSARRAAKMLIDWCDSQGGSNVGDGEWYGVAVVDAE